MCHRSCKGPTWVRTEIVGFRIQFAHPYNMGSVGANLASKHRRILRLQLWDVFSAWGAGVTKKLPRPSELQWRCEGEVLWACIVLTLRTHRNQMPCPYWLEGMDARWKRNVISPWERAQRALHLARIVLATCSMRGYLISIAMQ